MKKIFSMILLASVFVSLGLIIGCASDRSQLEPSWEKEVVIVFRRDITNNLIDYFIDSEHLQFMSQLEYNVVEAQIQTGESVAEFKDRLSTHPDILNIYTVQEYNALPQ